MRRGRLLCAQFVTASLLAALGGCDTTKYVNVNHANYGDAEYKTDLAQCRQQNTKIVEVAGYDTKTEAHVDEARAQACMTDRGWQPASK